jgi:hypothetical protein
VVSDLGCWIISGPRAMPESGAASWAIESLAASLSALEGLLRPQAIFVRSLAGEIQAPEPTLDSTRAVVARLPRPLATIEAQLDVHAYAVPEEAAEQGPQLCWIRVPNELVITRAQISGNAQLYLRMHHSLFAPVNPATSERNPLFRLNAPLLGSALARWQEAVGPITEIEGRGEGLSVQGFTG